MAARKNLAQTEKTREKIKTSQLINRLQNHVLRNTAMSATQVSAALGVLRKVLPDIEAIEHLGEVEHRHHVVSDQPLTVEEWAAKYGPGATPVAH
jgi:hypothetical protein